MQKLARNNFVYRIYYEDTDAGGVVYYANYLKFFERARTDFLREKGIVQSELAKNSGAVFVVRNCQIEYLQPARMDDLVEVAVEIIAIGKLSIQLKQEMKLHDKILSRINVEIVCVNAATFKPKRIAPEILSLLQFGSQN
ncbi:MAG: tol-pal system-associated acyl-CoA thioesterase [Pseudomonadota bacterium]